MDSCERARPEITRSETNVTEPITRVMTILTHGMNFQADIIPLKSTVSENCFTAPKVVRSCRLLGKEYLDIRPLQARTSTNRKQGWNG